MRPEEPGRAPTHIGLRCDAFGRLVFTDADGREYVDVRPVRAFPLSAPDEELSFVDASGSELAWLPRIDQLDPRQRALVDAALAQREFVPVLQRILRVSSTATPSSWDVQTDRGATTLVLGDEDAIRRLGADALLVVDTNGVQYLVPRISELDRRSRALLDRFM